MPLFRSCFWKQSCFCFSIIIMKHIRFLVGRLLGENGIYKRIDVLATAIFHSMTTEELLDLDLAYAPRIMEFGIDRKSVV